VAAATALLPAFAMACVRYLHSNADCSKARLLCAAAAPASRRHQSQSQYGRGDDQSIIGLARKLSSRAACFR